MITVAIADDHPLITSGIKKLLTNQQEIKFLFEASNGSEYLKLAEALEPDVLLLDIDMPILNGIETCKAIRAKSSPTKIIMLSMHNESGVIAQAVQAGANGYLLKNSDLQEILLAIQTVCSGQNYFSPSITVALLGGPKTTSSELPSEALSPREIEILQCIANGLTNKEIGDKLFISHRTVDTHRTNLMKKLNVNNVAGLVRFAIKNGYID